MFIKIQNIQKRELLGLGHLCQSINIINEITKSNIHEQGRPTTMNK